MPTLVRNIMTPDPTCLESAATARDAAICMRDEHIGDVPVVEDGVAVGIISLGDLAVEYDEESVLADVSAAPPDEQ